MALHEYALPYRMCPKTLQTLGRETFGGVLSKRAHGTGGTLCAHFRYDPDAPPHLGLLPCVRFYEIDQDYNVAAETSHNIAGLKYVHDLVVTESLYVVQMSPGVEISAEGVMNILGV